MQTTSVERVAAITGVGGFLLEKPPHKKYILARRPSDEEVLVARIIDRTLRPMFPPGFCRYVRSSHLRADLAVLLLHVK
jgi:hypothetical protein